MAGQGIQYSDIDILKTIGYVSALRGTDSTGIVQGRAFKGKIEKYLLDKQTYDYSYYEYFHEYGKGGNKDILSGVFNNFFMGHVRAATRGAVTEANAHPFDTGRYISMHNGTLKDHQYQSETKTDSELMFRDMEKDGIQKVLSDLHKESAYAVTILDTEDGMIRMARNSLRPLFVCFHKTRPVMYWASEDWMLSGCITRKGEKLHDDKIYYLEKDHIYSFDPHNVPRSPKELVKIPIHEKVTQKVQDKPRIKVKADIREVPDKPVAPLQGSGNNILSFPQSNAPKNTQKTGVLSSMRINPMFCSGCSAELTFLEQYYNKRGATYMCDTCETQAAAISMPFNLLN